MDRKELKLPFTIKNIPDWVCPTCGKGLLKMVEGSFKKEERFGSRDHSHNEWEPEWIETVYSCLLMCSNEKCKEYVASAGTGSVDWEESQTARGEPEQIYHDYFRPSFFCPHLKLLNIPKECPKSVSSPLEESFSLFFASPNAASNGVRVAIEALLTELKVRRYESVSGKRRIMSLHRRIPLLPAPYSRLKELLFAIKWLGNAGSHAGGTELTMDDVMDSYELTEHVLTEIYAPKLRKLNQLARKVNKEKGPIKKHTKLGAAVQLA